MTRDPGTGAVAAPQEGFTRLDVAWRVVLLAAFVLLTAPSWVSQMGVGLDPSWMVGLHLAAAKGLVHGRDFAFTYGPLGFALGPRELGSLDLHAVAIRLGLHLAWWTSVGFLLFRIRGVAAPLAFAAATAMSGVALENDYNFALTGVVILPVLGFLLLAELDRKPAWAVPATILAGAAMLMKFNLGVACTASLGVWSLMRLARDPSRRVVLRLALLGLAYFGTMTVLFLIYGGPISALWPFFRASREFASGYATQMTGEDPTNPGIWSAPAAFVLAAIALLVSLARRSRLTPAFALMIVPVFILYKGVIVRQSPGHFLMAWPVMVSMSALVLPAASRTLRMRAATTVAVLGMVAWGAWYAPMSFEKVVSRGPENLAMLFQLDKARSDVRAFDLSLKSEQGLPPQFLARIGDATVDVYPWETSYIWSNDLNWSPRPVFQAYAAYTPALDMMGADHYRGRQAPRFVIYSHLAIDYQNPCAVDSRTWIELYRWYDLVDGHGDKLLLERRETPRWRGAEPIARDSVGFVQSYELPRAGDGPIFLRAQMELSLLGKLQALVYKVDPPLMRVHYSDGEAVNYRMVWRNAAAGFMVGCLPRDLGAAIQLFQQGSADEVVSISFHDPSGRFKPEVKLETLKAGDAATVASTVEERAAR